MTDPAPTKPPPAVEPIGVRRYEAADAPLWDEFVRRARTGTFLFLRGYMDYHADRFADHSLVFLVGGRPAALLPANERGDILFSHGGLTFGGVLSDDRMRAGTMLRVFDALRSYLTAHGFARLRYKAVPHIYHTAPAEEDLYALFRHGARLVRRDMSATVRTAAPVGYAKGRKWSTRKALANGLTVGPSSDFRGFMALEEAHLRQKHGARPTHTGAELELLAGRFQENIRLYTAARGGELLGGVVVYRSRRVAHAQYIGATADGLALGAVDAVINHLLTAECAAADYFDFGTSMAPDGVSLNAGLVENKESYGGRAVCYDTYELDLTG